MGGCWDTENESPNNCRRCSRHAAVCYQTRESPSSGKCSIFCYRLTYISKMCSMHTKHFCWGINSNRKLFATGVPILPWMGPHVSFNSTWQLSSSPRLQWQHVIVDSGPGCGGYGCMYTVPLWHHPHECRISTHSNYLIVMSVSWLTDHHADHPPAASSRSWCHHSQSFTEF